MEAFQDEKPKEKKDCGGSSEDEQQKPFWRQTNKEFLAEKRKNGTGVFHPRNTQTCLKCNEAGHIASDCSKDIKAKQGASQKMNDKVVEKSEKSKILKNSKNEVGECSKKKTKFYKRQGNDNQVWVAKKVEEKVGDESGSTKPEEPQVMKKIPVNEDVFPSLKFEEMKGLRRSFQVGKCDAGIGILIDIMVM
ncbi:putative transcription factor interactor and regulator CCHC(Zn) family [Helianthus annuus]|nr:putative transcription factor interactor and regulator CCHC(Zn) family [Helianthus annuus]